MATPSTLTVASSPTAFSFSILSRCPAPAHKFLKPPTLTSPELPVSFRFFPTATSYCAPFSRCVRATKPDSDGNPPSLSPSLNSSLLSTFQEDVNYLWKLAFGSVIGAAVIKYGCIVFPDITKPDIVQALSMITAPMVASVILLFLGSRRD